MIKELKDLALAMYIGEPCRMCGERIEAKNINDAVFVGYSENNEARSAHLECWESNKNESTWVYQ